VSFDARLCQRKSWRNGVTSDWWGVTSFAVRTVEIWRGAEKFFRIFSRENNVVNKSIVASRSSGASSQSCSHDIHKQFTINILCTKNY